MNCKNCGYILWNLIARNCPECGEAFKPSEFEFVANSVQYCCPDCEQAYFGTAAQGHLSPVEFDCVKCGRHLHMDDMVLRPAEGVEEVRTRAAHMPWFERNERGAIKAWFSTIGMAMGSPGLLMRAIPNETSLGAAWSFMFFTNIIFRLVGTIIPAAVFLPLIMLITGTTTLGGAMATTGPNMIVDIAMQQLMWIVLSGALPAMWVFLTYGLLRLGGTVEGGWQRTWHAVCYASGANALSGIPCGCVTWGGPIWWAVSATLMVKEANKVSGGRATFAVIGSGFLVALAATAVAFAVTFGMYGPAAFGLGPTGFATMEAQAIVTGLTTYNVDNNGQWPPHAACLIETDDLTGWGFVGSDTDTFASDVPLANITLDDTDQLRSDKLRSAVQAATDALPANVIAHRLGDYVFTYHGIDSASADGGMWIVIFSPDPDANPYGIVNDHHCGTLDGRVVTVAAATVPSSLAAQNTLRANHGLPPLPDPATVTHTKPAAPGN